MNKLQERIYKMRECDHLVLMPNGFNEWKWEHSKDVFGVCPHCERNFKTMIGSNFNRKTGVN